MGLSYAGHSTNTGMRTIRRLGTTYSGIYMKKYVDFSFKNHIFTPDKSCFIYPDTIL